MVDLVLSEKQVSHKSRLSRRDFLKGTAALTIGLSGLSALVKTYSLSIQEPIKTIVYGPELQPIEVPPSLEHLDIPMFNENLTRPSKIVKNGIKLYENWRINNTELPPPRYHRPENYITSGKVIQWTFGKPIQPEEVAERYPMVKQAKTEVQARFDLDSFGLKIADRMWLNDIPHSMIKGYSQKLLESISTLIENDPGSGIVSRIIYELRNIHGESFEPLDTNGLFSRKKEDVQLAQNIFNDIYLSACNYIKSANSGKRVSTGLTLAYFLAMNKGNIVQSVWDNAILQRIIARNDPTTLKYNPTRERADLFSSLFYDEFSPQIPLDWLAEHVPTDDPVLNSPKPDDTPEYKDFMPINRANNHPLTLIAQTTVMDPTVVNLTTKYYYSDDQIKKQHGSVKLGADLLVLDDTPNLATIWAKYT